MDYAVVTRGAAHLLVGIGFWMVLIVLIFSIGELAFAGSLIAAGFALYSFPRTTLVSFAIVAAGAVYLLHIY